MIPPLLALLTPAWVGSSSSSSVGGLFLNNLQEYSFTCLYIYTKWQFAIWCHSLAIEITKGSRYNILTKLLEKHFYLQVPLLKVRASAHDLFKVVVAEMYFFLRCLVLNKSVFKVFKIFKDSSYPIPQKNRGHIRPASICLMGLFSWRQKKKIPGLCLIGATHRRTCFKWLKKYKLKE